MANGDFKNYFNCLESAVTLSNNEPMMLIDLALAEAGFGNAEKAKNIIDIIDTTNLPQFGDTFIKITQGIITIPDDEQMALEELGSAMLDLLQYSSNPAIWSILVLCSGWYALANKACGNIKEAENIICHIWPVLLANPDKTFINKIKSEIPGIEETIKNKPYVTQARHSKNIEVQANFNSETLRALYNFGVDDKMELKIEYFFYTNTIDKARSLQQELINKGYSVEVNESAANENEFSINGWTVPIEMKESVIDEWAKEMCDLGFKNDCLFDGWGTTPDQ